MVAGDPALVVALVSITAARETGGFVARESVGSLGLDHGRSAARSLLATGLRGTALAGGLGLREESLDPGLVDEVEGRAENAGQEEVEEDAVAESG